MNCESKNSVFFSWFKFFFPGEKIFWCNTFLVKQKLVKKMVKKKKIQETNLVKTKLVNKKDLRNKNAG